METKCVVTDKDLSIVNNVETVEQQIYWSAACVFMVGKHKQMSRCRKSVGPNMQSNQQQGNVEETWIVSYSADEKCKVSSQLDDQSD